MQSPGQLMPGPVTVPTPVPVRFTFSVNVVGEGDGDGEGEDDGDGEGEGDVDGDGDGDGLAEGEALGFGVGVVGGGATVMSRVQAATSVLPALVTRTVDAKTPGEVYVCAGFGLVDPLPSPNAQSYS